jgi:hypothetical protein
MRLCILVFGAAAQFASSVHINNEPHPGDGQITEDDEGPVAPKMTPSADMEVLNAGKVKDEQDEQLDSHGKAEETTTNQPEDQLEQAGESVDEEAEQKTNTNRTNATAWAKSFGGGEVEHMTNRTNATAWAKSFGGGEAKHKTNRTNATAWAKSFGGDMSQLEEAPLGEPNTEDGDGQVDHLSSSDQLEALVTTTKQPEEQLEQAGESVDEEAEQKTKSVDEEPEHNTNRTNATAWAKSFGGEVSQHKTNRTNATAWAKSFGGEEAQHKTNRTNATAWAKSFGDVDEKA